MVSDEEEIRFCRIMKCKIETEAGKIVVQKGTSVPQALEKKAQEHIDRLLRRKVLRESISNWRNPVRFLEKSNGDVRLVVNLIKLNDMVVKDNYAISNMKEILQKTCGAKWFSVIDLREAFYSIENEELDKQKKHLSTKEEYMNGTVWSWVTRICL